MTRAVAIAAALAGVPAGAMGLACYRDRPPEIVHRVEVVHDKVRVPCPSFPPPPAPVETCTNCDDHDVSPARPRFSCDGAPRDECDRIREAAWADYGKTAERWIRLYAWPTCTDAAR